MIPGSAASLWFPDFLIRVADALVIGAPPSVPPVAFDGLNPLIGVSDGFALYVGSREKERWTGANSAVLVPAFGLPEDAPRMFRGSHPDEMQAKPLEAIMMGLDVHIWGGEPPDTIALNSYQWDAEALRSACNILQNITRVLSYLSGSFGAMNDAIGWLNDTEALRHGEAFIYSWRASFAVYDFTEQALPVIDGFDVSNQPSIVRPGE